MEECFNLTLQLERGISGAKRAELSSPFLSIITRTQGRRPHTLIELLTCLAAQTDTDFEVLLLGHGLDPETRQLVLSIIDDCPSWLRRRLRYIGVQGGTRTRPLRIGLAEASGEFVAVLDDDDIIFAHWVESFRHLSRAMPGRVLRCNTVQQTVDTVSVQGLPGLRAEASPELRYPKAFDFFDHLLANRSPPTTLAFPRQLITFEGIDFDETLTTTEDWDFFMRCASTIGVADSANITSVYRWWNKGESSRTVHPQAEWQKNVQRIWKKWDDGGFHLPPGSILELLLLLQEHETFSAELRFQHQLGAKLTIDLALIHRNPEQRLTHAKLKVSSILNSTSWRVTRPFRFVSELAGGRKIDADWLQRATAEEAEALVTQLYRSRSWRLATPIRLVKILLERLRCGLRRNRHSNIDYPIQPALEARKS